MANKVMALDADETKGPSMVVFLDDKGTVVSRITVGLLTNSPMISTLVSEAEDDRDIELKSDMFTADAMKLLISFLENSKKNPLPEIADGYTVLPDWTAKFFDQIPMVFVKKEGEGEIDTLFADLYALANYLSLNQLLTLLAYRLSDFSRKGPQTKEALHKLLGGNLDAKGTVEFEPREKILASGKRSRSE